MLKPIHVLIKHWLSLFFKIAPTLCNWLILQFIKPSQLRHNYAKIHTKWHLKKRLKQKSPKKLKKKTQEVIMWFLLCSHSMILISKLWKKEVGLDSRVCINSKENENIMSFHSYIIIFLGIKEQAHSLGVPVFFYSRYSDYKSTT